MSSRSQYRHNPFTSKGRKRCKAKTSHKFNEEDKVNTYKKERSSWKEKQFEEKMLSASKRKISSVCSSGSDSSDDKETNKINHWILDITSFR